ncbi:MAG: DUF167 domain-containing protein [Halobacteriales archaeon]|nr:DUF167 domain-containing protein [Halobacteriales archaeon]
MAVLGDAVRAADGGTSLLVEVQQGARAEQFPAGFNGWRGRIQAKVRAPPEDGAANEALLRVVARFFGVPLARVALAAGATSRQKTIVVRGLRPDEARQALEGAL